ncbi:MAG: hypothetical protein Unbinned5079contig1000_22 [Prokaryotic dsDNA virus sp.]|nr:MAG: hypothetical protein Unbinned5079contig1000_22 [Prokaryotic dsDNA virus sp.]|tara:strand:+ start:573 stop:743 length:171 start_codon:yes stop_codon:yes gene_type:complete
MTSEEIKAERKRLGLTAEKMGKMLGVSTRAIFYYEDGQRKVPLTVEKLLRLLAEKD